MKNNKGFTVVELITSFALTMIITVFLFEVLIEVKDVFAETSVKTAIQEKLSIISKNIKAALPSDGTYLSCLDNTCNISGAVNSKIVIDKGDETTPAKVTVGNQVFNLPDGTVIEDYSLNPYVNPDDYNCYLSIYLKLNHSSLSKPYEYKITFYYFL